MNSWWCNAIRQKIKYFVRAKEKIENDNCVNCEERKNFDNTHSQLNPLKGSTIIGYSLSPIQRHKPNLTFSAFGTQAWIPSFVRSDVSTVRLSQYLDALTCCACTCDWYAHACNTHVQARDYRRNTAGYSSYSGCPPNTGFDFVVGVTNFRREWSVLCTAERICINLLRIQQRDCGL